MDRIEVFGNGSLLQHGAENSRVYLMKLHRNDLVRVADYIDRLASECSYTKLFAKIPSSVVPFFLERGYSQEAVVPRFFNGTEDAFFMVRYHSEARARLAEREELSAFGSLLAETSKVGFESKDSPFSLRSLGKADAGEMVGVYRHVFETYPFPIHDSQYVCQTMDDGVQYFGAYHGEQLVALSSAEVDTKNCNAEMTDFAALPIARGKNIASFLLNEMENAMSRAGISCLYTIARLRSAGMNKTFLRAGYRYAGTLINNTNIAGGIESMNVLYKHL